MQTEQELDQVFFKFNPTFLPEDVNERESLHIYKKAWIEGYKQTTQRPDFDTWFTLKYNEAFQNKDWTTCELLMADKNTLRRGYEGQ